MNLRMRSKVSETMVKKHKGGRRQILQLEDKKPSRGSASKSQEKSITHSSDSDDDSKKSSEWEPTSTAALNKDICPLDSQVADFFKEIDALTVNEQPAEESTEVSIPEASSEAKDVEEEGAKDSKPELQEATINNEVDTNQSVQLAEGIYCPWQEICDETSGYNYYWNTQTNEVTWECPPDYEAYLKARTSDEKHYEVHLNVTEVQKKSRRGKKRNLLEPANPEGAVIPISSFGGSSSDESSGAESENRLLSSSVNKSLNADLRQNLKTDPNMPSSSKSKSFKEDNDYQANSSEYAEVIGPQLPPNFNFPQSVPLQPEVSRLPNYSASSKNEVEEFVEVGHQLPSAATNDSSGVMSSASVMNTETLVSDNINPSQSHTNGLSVASSSLENCWKGSPVKNTEKANKSSVREVGEESPDSTVRKGDTFSENGVSGTANCQTSSSTNPKHRLIVEYDSFTDEDEDGSFSDISSSKQTVNSKNSVYQNFRLAGNGSKREGVNDYNIDDDQQKVESNVSKRKISDEHMEKNMKKAKDEKKDFLDIDSLFAAHASYGKYGFGFSKQKQLTLENDFCAVDNDASKVTSDSKAVNFVKSDHVFELNTLNENISSSKSLSNSHIVEEKQQLISNGNCDLPPSETALQKLDRILKTEFSREKNTVAEVRILTSGKKIKSPFPAELNIDLIRKKKDTLLQEGRNALSYSSILSRKLEPDIEEIDKALCDALEAKKAMASQNSLSKPSSSTSTIPTVKKCSEIASNLSVKNKETDTSGLNSTNDPDMMMSIMDLSSVLVDKLTFLLSSHSSLASLSTILIQLQTRHVDWQAGALESKYFMSRLQEVNQYLHHYEMASLSGDWICQWSRENKRYFYVNNRTQHSQWTYPEELCNQEKTSWMNTSDVVATSSASGFASEKRDDLQTVSSSVPERQLPESRPASFAFDSRKERGGVSGQYSDSATGWSSPPPPPPGVDSPPPPPPQSPPPDSPPPPPPDSTEVGDLPEDMDLDSDDSGPLPFISQCSSDKDMHMQYPPFRALRSPERSPENFPSTSISNAVSSTSLSFCDDLNVPMKSPQPVSNSLDCLDPVNMMWTVTNTQPSCSSGNNYSFDRGNEARVNDFLSSSTETKEYEMCASSSSGGSIYSSDSFFYRKTSPYSTAMKKEKKKPNNLPGLALKKKNIPTLVEKWQKIKEEQDKEDKNSDDTKNSNGV
ncbi:uncharacterized protein LOC118186561 [Stegodyphus dumicola]|uniref:uncharacterized protein LOC118186561 n=1 Tax=Stegodyphus dumicola TaxID=202533 RepID=UPI0015B1212E|nr:uncharacterized protein LOC118186561 [Stegodyphus dumicola]